ncbi:MAG: DUF4303 domain-containing protein [Cyanobacteria bacterium P01_E01_bin.42]
MTLSFTFKQLHDLTYQATQLAFLKAKEQSFHEIMYVFTLHHSGIFGYLMPFYNTEESLQKTAIAYFINQCDGGYIESIKKELCWNPRDYTYKEHYRKYFDEIYQMDSKEIDAIKQEIRWNPGDWGYPEDKGGYFEKINQMLREVPNYLCGLSEFDSGLTYQVIEDTILTALSKCDSEGIFGKGQERNFIVINLSEFDQDELSQLETAQRLNSPEVYRRYKKELEEMYGIRL